MPIAITALFDDRATAEKAVHELVARGIKHADISLLASTESGEYREFAPKASHGQETLAEYEAGDRAAAGMGIGAGIGALAGLAWLAVPGVGPLLAAGQIALALGVGAVTGGVAGGIMGAMVDVGIAEDEAEYFAEGLRRGGSVVTVATQKDQAVEVARLLRDADAVDLNQRIEEWRQAGWKPLQEPVSPNPPGVAVPTPGSSKPSYVAAERHGQPSTAALVTDPDDVALDNTYSENEVREVYAYGQFLAAKGTGDAWESVEPGAAQEWERRHPGTWENVKEAARSAYERGARKTDASF